jgi:hypothetical protein
MIDFRVRYRSIVLKYAYGIGLVNTGAVRHCGDDDWRDEGLSENPQSHRRKKATANTFRATY